MSNGRRHASARDAGLRQVRRLTWAAIAAAAGLAGAFSTAAAVTFSGKLSAAPARVPPVPMEAAPVQHAPPPPIVIRHVVHHRSTQTWASAPAGPLGAPAAAPPPPPPPACVSTPSHPC